MKSIGKLDKINKFLTNTETFGFSNKITKCLFAGLALVLSIYIELLVYNFFPLESHKIAFALWITSSLIGAIFLGLWTDNFPKVTLLFSQFLGMLLLITVYFTGLNAVVLCLLALVYNPRTISRAILTHELHNTKLLKTTMTDPKIIAVTQVLQAAPWYFFSLPKHFSLTESILGVSVLIFLLNIGIIYFYSSTKSSRKKTDISTKKSMFQISKISNLTYLIAFVIAEMVYFITSLGVAGNTIYDAEVLFQVIVIGVLIGSSIHFIIPHEKYHVSYRLVTSFIYCMGGLFVGLITLSAFLFEQKENMILYLGAIASLGALYIPLAFSCLFQMMHAKHRGLASGIGEGIQSLAYFFASLLIPFLYNSPYLLGFLLSIFYFVSFGLSIVRKKESKERA